jgi:hypothetical protein
MLFKHFPTQNTRERTGTRRLEAILSEIAKSGHRWVDVKAAAAHASVGLSKFWQMLSRGDVLAIRNGRKVLVDLNSIDEFYLRCPRVAEPREVAELADLRISSAELSGHE